jgi:hypothetical protein
MHFIQNPFILYAWDGNNILLICELWLINWVSRHLFLLAKLVNLQSISSYTVINRCIGVMWNVLLLHVVRFLLIVYFQSNIISHSITFSKKKCLLPCRIKVNCRRQWLVFWAIQNMRSKLTENPIFILIVIWQFLLLVTPMPLEQKAYRHHWLLWWVPVILSVFPFPITVLPAYEPDGGM